MKLWGLGKTKESHQPPTKPVNYPSGVCVSTEKGWYYLRNGKRFVVPTKRVLDSWGFPRIIPSTMAAIADYKAGGKLGFREGSLINDISNAKLYVISENKRRQIIDPDVLERLNVRLDDFVYVSASEANLHDDGEAFN